MNQILKAMFKDAQERIYSADFFAVTFCYKKILTFYLKD